MSAYPLPLNILVADDHQLIIDGMLHILCDAAITGEVHTAKNGQEAVNKVQHQNIDCVFMDINMPGLSGLEATRQIKKIKPFVKIIVVSMQCDPAMVRKMLKAGADAFINKDTGKTEVFAALEKIREGGKYISPDISLTLFTHLNDRTLQGETAGKLTPRELEILRHIAGGMTDTQIAAKLFLSNVTVNTHRKNMLAKLGLKNTAMLVKYAADNQLL